MKSIVIGMTAVAAITASVFGSLAAAALLFSANAFAGPGKVDVCHIPPDDPLNVRPLSLPDNRALTNHLLHGDRLISEERCDLIADNNCDGEADPQADDADCASQLGGNATCVEGGCVPGGTTPVGTITADILRGGNPPGSDRGVESAAGNLVADAFQWATLASGAQLAFMNPGGIRSDLIYAGATDEQAGEVTFGEAFDILPFGNKLVTFPMTGAQIVSVLADQCQPADATRPFLHLGVSEGFTYDLGRTVENGICTSITISNVELYGMPLEVDTTYLVTTSNFLADGGDNFDTFATIDPSTRIDGGVDLDAFIGFLGAFSPVAPPPTDRVNEL